MPKNEIENTAPNKDTTSNKLKILIAEDDYVSYLYISTILKNIAKELIHAKTGVEVIELCKKHPDIDVILMDIKMPILNGYEATKKIREFNTDIIIIAQTAYALSGDNKKAIDAGCNDYITKPINKEILFQVLDKQRNS
ncbi:MAG: CheY-like chemotaxis protein [Polaribacter sp.]|jgi:CheY-like chemotaxis protein